MFLLSLIYFGLVSTNLSSAERLKVDTACVSVEPALILRNVFLKFM